MDHHTTGGVVNSRFLQINNRSKIKSYRSLIYLFF